MCIRSGKSYHWDESSELDNFKMDSTLAKTLSKLRDQLESFRHETNAYQAASDKTIARLEAAREPQTKCEEARAPLL